MTNKKKLLIASFVRKPKIFSFLESLHTTYHIPYERIFVFEIEDNEFEYLVTFNVKEEMRQTVLSDKKMSVVHIKNGSIFSINALNKLIEIENGDAEHDKTMIDWEKYKDRLMIISGGELNIKKIRKIEDKGQLFVF